MHRILNRFIRDFNEDIGGYFSSDQPQPSKGPKQVEIPVEKLTAQMKGLLIVVDQMFAQTRARSQNSGLKLDEIKLSVEVNASGQISIVGSGIARGDKGAIKLNLSARISLPIP